MKKYFGYTKPYSFRNWLYNLPTGLCMLIDSIVFILSFGLIYSNFLWYIRIWQLNNLENQ
jgi:hypothetical protein